MYLEDSGIFGSEGGQEKRVGDVEQNKETGIHYSREGEGVIQRLKGIRNEMRRETPMLWQPQFPRGRGGIRWGTE